MRGRHAALLAVLALAACAPDVTAIMVTVVFDDGAHHPATLAVTVTAGSKTLRSDASVSPEGRAVRSGDAFAVVMPDAVAGERVDVAVVAIEGGAHGVAGHAATVAVLHRTVALMVPLGVGGDDMGVSDMRDLAGIDGAIDLALSDASCTPRCTSGVAYQCTDGGVASTTCAFGCDGTRCVAANSCATAGDVSSGGSFAGTSVGGPDSTSGSCGGAAGPEVVLSIAQSAWRAVALDATGTSYAAALYLRESCGAASSEVPLAGPCAGAATGSGTACSSGTAPKLVACGLPPGAYAAFLDGNAAGGGAWRVNVTTAIADLNSCAGAGNLLAGGSFTASTVAHANHFTATTNGCGDKGATSPDATFFFATSAPHNVTISTAGSTFQHIVSLRPSCTAADSACAASAGNNTATLTANALPPGLYFVVVDGQKGQTGDIKLTLALQ